MIIDRLSLNQFRNYDQCSAAFEPGLNVIIGKNASGKTNSVEAIYFLSLGRSFRTDQDKELIHDNCDFASIEGHFILDDESKNVRIIVSKLGKKVLCNGIELKRMTELTSILNAIVFKPEDVLMFDDSPSVRRKYLDLTIARMDASYLRSMTEFDRLLKERNEILKQDKVDRLQLDIVTDQLISSQKQIILKRQALTERINQIIHKVIASLKGTHEKVEMRYFAYVKSDDQYETLAKKAYNDALDSDLKHRSTSVGVHREDFVVLQNGQNIATYGSQGEKRMMAIALKLCPYFLVEDKARRPIVILDDVLSELDANHRLRLINFVSRMEQCFITATDFKEKGAAIYVVANHKLTRR